MARPASSSEASNACAAATILDVASAAVLVAVADGAAARCAIAVAETIEKRLSVVNVAARRLMRMLDSVRLTCRDEGEKNVTAPATKGTTVASWRLVAVRFVFTMDRAPTVTIHVPGPLRAYCAGAAQIAIAACTVRAVLEDLEWSQSALYRNVCDETGTLRRHLNVFVNADNVRDLDGIDTTLTAGDVVTILPAVSGG